ncbi:MAG TPA: hybrid sensor histidine kinase/response regulator [Vicinamibacterales bacterium]|nr:hybrid sensor histidine kinase/response regulator [Vicinamibacterales bacterium]
MTMAADVILVVDDDDAARFVKVQTLRRAGFTVYETATGTEGLALIERQRPVVVVLDINLPDVSGIDITRRLRAAEQGPPTLQILQMSSTAVQTADRVRGLDQGADVYLTEPVDGAVLVATVHSLLRVRRAEEAMAAALESEQRARGIAEEASRMKDDFLATLSHELRTPLNALMGWVWQLQHTPLNEQARARALESLDRNARAQAQLINDLLDVTRISKGKLHLEMRVVDLKQVVETACEMIGDSARAKGIEVATDAAPTFVAGDEGRLLQIATNLLTNAVQFTPSGGRITVSVGGDDEQAVLSVQDTGAGIDPKLLPHIFDSFRQGEGHLSRRHGGLGLGLAVVRQLVELHGGTTEVQSEGTGRGATFIVRLPRETVLPAGASDAPLLADLGILVVADPEMDVEALKESLEASGARVAVAPPQAPAPDSDVVLRRSEGELTMQLAAVSPAEALPESIEPADLVRRIARLVAQGSV